jgi:hypothetical protein
MAAFIAATARGDIPTGSIEYETIFVVGMTLFVFTLIHLDVDPGVIGRTIQLDGWGSVVVGVLPPTFRIYLPADAAMPTNVDAWGVLPINISEFARDAPWLTVVTRLESTSPTSIATVRSKITVSARVVSRIAR